MKNKTVLYIDPHVKAAIAGENLWSYVLRLQRAKKFGSLHVFNANMLHDESSIHQYHIRDIFQKMSRVVAANLREERVPTFISGRAVSPLSCDVLEAELKVPSVKR